MGKKNKPRLATSVKISDKRIKINVTDVKNSCENFHKIMYNVWRGCPQKITTFGKVAGTEIESVNTQ